MSGCETNQYEIENFSEVFSGLFYFMECVIRGLSYNLTG